MQSKNIANDGEAVEPSATSGVLVPRSSFERWSCDDVAPVPEQFINCVVAIARAIDATLSRNMLGWAPVLLDVVAELLASDLDDLTRDELDSTIKEHALRGRYAPTLWRSERRPNP